MEITKEEREEVERATQRYKESQRRKSELPEKDKRLFEQFEAIETGYYCPDVSMLKTIVFVYQESVLDCLFAIYRYGFLKGMRKAKADMKRKNK